MNPKRIEDLRDFDGDGVADDDRRNTIFFEVPDRRKPIAMLPQGLSLAYQNEDHHVLQYSYSFIQDGWVSKPSRWPWGAVAKVRSGFMLPAPNDFRLTRA